MPPNCSAGPPMSNYYLWPLAGYAATRAILLCWCHHVTDFFLSFSFFLYFIFFSANFRDRSLDRHQILTVVQRWPKFMAFTVSWSKLFPRPTTLCEKIYFLLSLIVIHPGFPVLGKITYKMISNQNQNHKDVLQLLQHNIHVQKFSEIMPLCNVQKCIRTLSIQ